MAWKLVVGIAGMNEPFAAGTAYVRMSTAAGRAHVADGMPSTEFDWPLIGPSCPPELTFLVLLAWHGLSQCIPRYFPYRHRGVAVRGGLLVVLICRSDRHLTR